MEPEHLRFGGGAADTLIHPLVAVYLLIAILLILALPRSKAIVPFLLAYFTIATGQVVVLGGLHFTALRILILAGLARMASSRQSSSGGRYPGGFNPVDQMVVLWSVSAIVIFCLQYMQREVLINSLGVIIDTLGGYLVVRFLISDGKAVRRTIGVLAVICVVQGACMLNEQINHFNVFGLLGGIPVEVLVREGHIRSSGVMGYIWAGAFAGAVIPLFLWLWTERKSRMLACAGLVGATTMVISSHSSTSLLAFGGSLLGICFWPLRKDMRLIRWGLVTMIVGLHLVMKAPVWALIARIDLTGSSSGDHRYHLVDSCIRHFWDWWLLGYRDYNLWGWDAWDLSNQFVAVALGGGLLSLIFYIAIFKRSFGAIGMIRKQVNGDRGQEWFLWCLGSDLFGTVMAHFGINYPAQLVMGFFVLLAFISIAICEARQTVVEEAEIPRDSHLASYPTRSVLRLPVDQKISRVHPRTTRLKMLSDRSKS